MNSEPFIIERTFNAPVSRVWNAITDRDEMQQWYFNIQAFRPEVGFEFQFVAGDENKSWLHLCKVLEVIPGRLITYSWRYDGYSGNSFVTFELTDMGDQTLLKLTHAQLETFPPIPELAKQNFAMGWTQIIGTALSGYLEKKG